MAEGEKLIELVDGGVRIRAVDRDGNVWPVGPKFPLDKEASAIYYSRMGGFVPPEVAIDTVLSNPAHYGAGGFEGVRVVRTPYGEGFVELSSNLARFRFSTLAFGLGLITDTLKLFDDPNIDRIEHLQRTPAQFFVGGRKALEADSELTMDVKVIYKDSREEIVTIPFQLRAMMGEEERVVTLREMETAMLVLPHLNGLVKDVQYPEDLRLINSGYFRPVFWISGEEGLKVPTVGKRPNGTLFDKPLYFAIATLPWGRYLDEAGYNAGLDVMIAPYLRLDDLSMPVTQKIAGNYVNSARNINIAVKLGFGEILALNHKEEVVEGSAENLVFLFEEEGTGKLRALVPPLSSNILAGTNRDRLIRVLQEGVEVNGKEVELEMRAPSKDELYRSLDGKSKWKLSALVMMGTGVGFIHVKSITEYPDIDQVMKLGDLRSEETYSDPLVIRRLTESGRKRMINNGQKHPFVDIVQQRYTEFVLADRGRLVTPVHAVDLDVAAKLFGVGIEEHTTSEIRSKAANGHYRERVNGLHQPDELRAKMREIGDALRSMYKESIRQRSKPYAEVFTLRK